ncbi:MAG: response regulator [Treponema sp.]|jgi:two-component system chemotaxis response regulator CheY|nr:response regulator [Treponema sp.]
MKLLIVDDSLMMRKMVERALAEKNFTIAGTAQNGEEALEIFAKTLPDLVTLDISMPKMDGLSCLMEMLKIKGDAKILMVSSQSDTAIAKETLARGAAGFITKPFSAADLIKKVNEILGA